MLSVYGSCYGYCMETNKNPTTTKTFTVEVTSDGYGMHIVKIGDTVVTVNNEGLHNFAGSIIAESVYR